MEIKTEQKLLRIFMSNTDKFNHQPLYELIVYAAKKHNLAGATVLKGIMSFGSSSGINSLKLWEISEKVPIIVEIIDVSIKIDTFVDILKPYLEAVDKGILVTIQKLDFVLFKTGKKQK